MATKDLVADYSGVGDGQRVSVTGSITSGASPVFTPTSNIFAANGGDPTGKAIYLVTSGWTYPTGVTVVTVTSYNSGTGAVTLSGTNSTAKTSVTMDVLWGTDNSAFFLSFRSFAQTQGSTQTQLTIPAGRYCVSLNPFQQLTVNTQNILISGPLGAASTCILSQLVPAEMRFGGTLPIRGGLGAASGASARLQTCTRGSTTATLVDKTNYGTLLTSGVGGMCFVTAYDRQSRNASPYGYPPNPHFHETNRITAYDSGTGVITFQNPLSNTYKSTYPSWYSGDLNNADPGGPATIYVLTDYDRVVEINDIKIDNPYHQTSCLGRTVILRRSICPGFYPTQNESFSAYSTSWSGTEMEVDKIVGTTLFDGCDMGILKHQSASPNVCIVQNNCTFGQISGTPRRITVSDSAVGQFQIGALAFGHTDEVTITNVTGITSISTGASGTDGIHSGGVSATMSITNGLFSFLKTDNDGAGGEENPVRGLVPGAWIFTVDNKLLFQITDVYEDGTYCYVQTSLTGSWPITVTGLRCHPAPIFTMRNCTGTAPNLEDFNNSPARAPIFTYSKRTRVAGATATTAEGIPAFPIVRGNIQYIKETVVTPYVAGALTHRFSQFNNWPLLKSDLTTTVSIGATVINMQTTGVRTLVPNVAGSGGVTGDTLDNLSGTGPLWMYTKQNNGSVFSSNVSNGETPTTITEILADQGIPPPVPAAVAPLRLRLRG